MSELIKEPLPVEILDAAITIQDWMAKNGYDHDWQFMNICHRNYARKCAILEARLAEATQTIEDVATGAGITCIRCGKDTRWCKCNE